MRVGITFGTFDLLHIGHVNILERSKQACDFLVVGVSTDALNFSKKQAYPVYSEQERLKIIASLRMVDQVFLEESLEKKRDYIQQYKANLLIMGDDWAGKFDFCSDLCEVLYLPRTPHISTTSVKAEVFTRHISQVQRKTAGT